jgi:2-oxoglutarate dehydrogenase E1 component
MVEAPIFHVNGDDPEACAWVAQIALEYRQQFREDVVIDLWCYRKYGHNEGDEPTFTQPRMYDKVRKQKPVLKQYVERLVNEGVITQKDAERLYKQLRDKLDESQTRTKGQPVAPSVGAFASQWANLTEHYSDEPVDTTTTRDALHAVATALGTVPAGFNVHKKLTKVLDGRRQAIPKNLPLDWAMGELLAYGTLLLEGHAVRLTGQDVERGTFSHRHAVLFDTETNEPYTPLEHIEGKQAKFCIHNSPLTESACVGFEYGYSLTDPQMLVVWEAQFGDFANGAQVIIDQFIASAEIKWERHTGLVLFLPHGYEGQGPEHSSARLERFLTNCARNNMLVCYPTTPAQHFHMLRQQLKRNFRKPLIVMTPKSLLRHPKATSSVDDLMKGAFHRVLDDPSVKSAESISQVLFCTGKVYYDLIAHREAAERDDVAIIRIEQLYPFPEQPIREVLDRYKKAEQFVWVQEEPKNMGAWRHMDAYFREVLEVTLPYVGRDANASPAVASTKMHAQEQEKILITAIGLPSTKSGGAKESEKKKSVAASH